MDDARCVRDGCGRSCVFCIRGENFADMANRYKTPCQLVFQRRQKVHLHAVITTAAGTASRARSWRISSCYGRFQSEFYRSDDQSRQIFSVTLMRCGREDHGP